VLIVITLSEQFVRLKNGGQVIGVHPQQNHRFAFVNTLIRAEDLKLEKRFDLREDILFRGKNRDIIIEPQFGWTAQRAEGEAVIFRLRGYYGPAGLQHRRDKFIELL